MRVFSLAILLSAIALQLYYGTALTDAILASYRHEEAIDFTTVVLGGKCTIRTEII